MKSIVEKSNPRKKQGRKKTAFSSTMEGKFWLPFQGAGSVHLFTFKPVRSRGVLLIPEPITGMEAGTRALWVWEWPHPAQAAPLPGAGGGMNV